MSHLQGALLRKWAFSSEMASNTWGLDSIAVRLIDATCLIIDWKLNWCLLVGKLKIQNSAMLSRVDVEEGLSYFMRNQHIILTLVPQNPFYHRASQVYIIKLLNAVFFH